MSIISQQKLTIGERLEEVKLILAMCLVPLVTWSADSRADLSWNNLISEGKALTRAGKYPLAAQAFRQASDSRRLKRWQPDALGIHDALTSVVPAHRKALPPFLSVLKESL